MLKIKYGDKADCLIYKIKSENVYEDLYKNKKLFNFSNYPKDSKYYNGVNNIVIGKMEHETCGVPIKVFVGLKSKMYFITDANHESKNVNNINKNIVDDELKYEGYENALFNRLYTRHEHEQHIFFYKIYIFHSTN